MENLSAAAIAGKAIPFTTALESAAVHEDRLDEIGPHALVLGNGDINALLWSQGGALAMRLTKNDVWDHRIDTSEDPPLCHIDIREHTWEGGASEIPSWHGRPYPLPRVYATVTIGDPTTPAPAAWDACLDLQRAVATLAPNTGGPGQTRVRALAGRNVFFIETSAAVSLAPHPADYLPPASEGEDGGTRWLLQEMPGDATGDYAGMRVAVALAQSSGRAVLAVVTSFESADPLAAACDLAGTTLAVEPATLLREHEARWTEFWSASGVELGDRALQDWWYRCLYYMRCFCTPGAWAIGCFAGLADDTPGWHSGFTLDYNTQQTYWPAFVTNHVEMAEPYARLVNHYLPRARWLAGETYGCAGAFFPSNMYGIEPPDPLACRSRNHRQLAYVPWSYALGLSGWIVQVLWQRYLYAPDRAYLAGAVWPSLSAVATFYAEVVERCGPGEDGSLRIGPSFSPEHGPFGTDNTPVDLAYIRSTFEWTIEAATVLGIEGDLAARCSTLLDRLPPYPVALAADGQEIVVDWQGCGSDEVPEHNVAVPTVPLFPAERVHWFSPEGEKALFARTLAALRHNGNNAHVMTNVARARLSLPSAVEETRRWFSSVAQPNGMFRWQGHGYYLSESSAVAGLVSEFLLQSVGGIVRVFPAWPADVEARFTRLRAQGGFLVSATQAGGRVTQLDVVSTVGGLLRLLTPWPAINLRRPDGATTRLAPDERGIVTLTTGADESLSFAAA